MKKHTFSDVFIRPVMVMAMILSATGYLTACSGKSTGATPAAMSPVAASSVESTKEKGMSESQMMDRCTEMAQQKQKMMEAMKAQDTELTVQLTMMNSAAKKEKVPLMAAIITTMVEQRIARDAQKAKMEEEMMRHMMQHMQMGKDSMAQCPMMKDMKGMHHNSMDAKKNVQ